MLKRFKLELEEKRVTTSSLEDSAKRYLVRIWIRMGSLMICILVKMARGDIVIVYSNGKLVKS